MITIEAVNSDIDKISADDKLTETQKLIQIIKVIMKFVSTMRSNQLLTEEDKKELKKRKKEEKK